jgi:hypothetical protein
MFDNNKQCKVKDKDLEDMSYVQSERNNASPWKPKNLDDRWSEVR